MLLYNEYTFHLKIGSTEEHTSHSCKPRFATKNQRRHQEKTDTYFQLVPLHQSKKESSLLKNPLLQALVDRMTLCSNVKKHCAPSCLAHLTSQCLICCHVQSNTKSMSTSSMKQRPTSKLAIKTLNC